MVGTLKFTIIRNCYYVCQLGSSSIQDDLRLSFSFDEGHMSNSETISFYQVGRNWKSFKVTFRFVN